MNQNQPGERALRIAEEINKRTATRHYRIVLNTSRQPAITGSKTGGLPYWPSNKDYPTDDQGNKMMMLMQINCGEAHLASPLPDTGMLQWFISTRADAMYGIQGNISGDSNRFRVVYHPVIDNLVTPQTVESMDVPTHSTVADHLTPVKREVAIDVTLETTHMGVTDGRFSAIFNQVVKEMTGEDLGNQPWNDYMGNADNVYFENNIGMKAPRHQLLGYPTFTQEDPRANQEEYGTLLLELDSQFDEQNTPLVMWGDMGSGYIFISEANLQALRFDKVLYTWDCG